MVKLGVPSCRQNLGYGMPLPSEGIVALVFDEHRPEHTCMLVGDGYQGLVIALTAMKIDDPSLQTICAGGVYPKRRLQRASGPLDQERAQVDIAAQADASQPGPAARTMLSRRETKPGAKLSPVPEDLCIGYRGRQRARCDRADAK